MLVTKNMDLKKIRKDVKKIGYNFRLKKYSDFDTLEFYHIQSKRLYPSIFTKENLIFWDDLIQYLKGV